MGREDLGGHEPTKDYSERLLRSHFGSSRNTCLRFPSLRSSTFSTMQSEMKKEFLDDYMLPWQASQAIDVEEESWGPEWPGGPLCAGHGQPSPSGDTGSQDWHWHEGRWAECKPEQNRWQADASWSDSQPWSGNHPWSSDWYRGCWNSSWSSTSWQ